MEVCFLPCLNNRATEASAAVFHVIVTLPPNGSFSSYCLRLSVAGLLVMWGCRNWRRWRKFSRLVRPDWCSLARTTMTCWKPTAFCAGTLYWQKWEIISCLSVRFSEEATDSLATSLPSVPNLQQVEEARDTEMTDLNALTEEFTRRMGESERKLQAVLKEKETLKHQLQMAEGELAKRSSDTSLQALLEEKDEQIAGLMEEGEKLSKQQLQNSNIIKKLRTKEKENEGVIASQKKKLEQQTEELEQLKKVLDVKEDMEKNQADAIKQLNAAVQMLEKEKAKMKIDVDSADEKIRGLQATLDNSYKEIAELHKSNAAQDSRAQQAALSAEMQVREELKMAMEQEGQRYRQEREALITQIEDLRLSMARMEKDHNRREEILKQEISDLQMVCA
ncbi:hypothetical protein BaRGS_00014308 [Batillaria attramentaria]|uniref:Uncharacterized protein n=1 Tax=Batillaria attramentaria TaxID=370345 RepID=A0ABD0L532_9CAEN